MSTEPNVTKAMQSRARTQSKQQELDRTAAKGNCTGQAEVNNSITLSSARHIAGHDVQTHIPTVAGQTATRRGHNQQASAHAKRQAPIPAAVVQQGKERLTTRESSSTTQ